MESRMAVGQRAATGWVRPAEAAMAMGAVPRAAWRRANEVAGEKRGVGGGGDEPIEAEGGGVIEAGEDAGEGAWVIGDGIGEDVEAEAGEAGRVAVGVEDEGFELGAEALDDMGEDGGARRGEAGSCPRRPCVGRGRRRG